MKMRVCAFIATVITLGCEDPVGTKSGKPVVPVTTQSREMKLIPAKGATFRMGIEENAFWVEPHTQMVQLTHDFYIDSTEVTQKDYHELMSHTYNNYVSPPWADSFGGGVGDNNPAYSINWYEAILYCNARSKFDGKDTVYEYDSIVSAPGMWVDTILGYRADLKKNGYHLPTEAQWEYACRAGSSESEQFYWKNPVLESVCDTCNQEFEELKAGLSAHSWWVLNAFGRNHEVAQLIPNSYGLYDMSGNVSEWCHDMFDAYELDLQIDPVVEVSGRVDDMRIHRGGSWGNMSTQLRWADRDLQKMKRNSPTVGFRVVCR